MKDHHSLLDEADHAPITGVRPSRPRTRLGLGDAQRQPAPAELDVFDDAPERELPVPAGTVLAERYVVESLLAEGGMGVVCLGHHVQLDQPVAIKFLRRALSGSATVVQRFLNEARALASLRSQHVVRVLDVGQLDSGRPYFVMEYLEGIDLEAYLQSNGPLSVEAAILYVLEACDALGEAHACGIVHRDVKPENLLLSTASPSKDIIKVLDFGVAKRVGSPKVLGVTGPQDSLGSPWYMSPEQILTPQLVDPRSDIWSLGVVLHRLLTGTLPFDGNNSVEVFGRVLNEAPRALRAALPTLDTRLEQIVLCCLEKGAGTRYQTIGQLADALNDYLSYRREGSLADSSVNVMPFPLVTSRPPPPPSEEYDFEPRPRKRSKLLLGVLSALLVLGAAGLYVAVAERAGMIHVGVPSLALARLAPPPLEADVLPPVDLDSDAFSVSVFPRGVMGTPAARGTAGRRALRAEPEIDRELDNDEELGAEGETASEPTAEPPQLANPAPAARPARPASAKPPPAQPPRAARRAPARASSDEPAAPIIRPVTLPEPEPSSSAPEPSNAAPEPSAPADPDVPSEYRE